MDNQRRDRNRYGGNRYNTDEATPRKPEPRRDPGAYIGRMPERQPEPVAGAAAGKDVPVAAVPSQPTPPRAATTANATTQPDAAREPANATDAVVKEAGQNR